MAYSPTMPLLYSCILLKLSGELFMNRKACIDAGAVNVVAQEIVAVARKGVRIGVVVGGGNIMRGRTIKGTREDARAGHRAGMVATVVNGIMLSQALKRQGVRTKLFSAFAVGRCAVSSRADMIARAVRVHQVVLFVGGTGLPFRSTDSVVVRRAKEIGARAVLKVTANVDGVYDRDPRRFTRAKRYRSVSYEVAVKKKLGVMDLDAFKKARQARLPIHIFQYKKGRILQVLKGRAIGSVVR